MIFMRQHHPRVGLVCSGCKFEHSSIVSCVSSKLLFPWVVYAVKVAAGVRRMILLIGTCLEEQMESGE